ncbi:hypothetical protein [Streptacidiphilus sp. EB103A]|uniref:hypothetical protein n=1 Tax=Streptacidiphilus sp. EB103A TaxID=3156275 RepID=UPI003510E23C
MISYLLSWSLMGRRSDEGPILLTEGDILMHLTRPVQFLSRALRACAAFGVSAVMMVGVAPNAQVARADELRSSAPACPLTSHLVSPQLEKALDCWQRLLVGKTIVENGRPVGPDQISASDLPQENARVVGPDTPVSVDYVPNRLNITTNAQGLIDKVTLG